MSPRPLRPTTIAQIELFATLLLVAATILFSIVAVQLSQKQAEIAEAQTELQETATDSAAFDTSATCVAARTEALALADRGVPADEIRLLMEQEGGGSHVLTDGSCGDVIEELVRIATTYPNR